MGNIKYVMIIKFIKPIFQIRQDRHGIPNDWGLFFKSFWVFFVVIVYSKCEF